MKIKIFILFFVLPSRVTITTNSLPSAQRPDEGGAAQAAQEGHVAGDRSQERVAPDCQQLPPFINSPRSVPSLLRVRVDPAVPGVRRPPQAVPHQAPSP